MKKKRINKIICWVSVNKKTGLDDLLLINGLAYPTLGYRRKDVVDKNQPNRVAKKVEIKIIN